jgi:hypothetical protein
MGYNKGKGGKVKGIRIGIRKFLMVKLIIQKKNNTEQKIPGTQTTKSSVTWKKFLTYSLDIQSWYWPINGSSDVVYLPTPWEHNPVQPLGRLTHPNKTEKHEQQTVI